LGQANLSINIAYCTATAGATWTLWASSNAYFAVTLGPRLKIAIGVNPGQWLQNMANDKAQGESESEAAEQTAEEVEEDASLAEASDGEVIDIGEGGQPATEVADLGGTDALTGSVDATLESSAVNSEVTGLETSAIESGVVEATPAAEAAVLDAAGGAAEDGSVFSMLAECGLECDIIIGFLG
jgi:hypothetical protein